MLLFCRNCGKELSLTAEKTCVHCGSKPTRGTAYCRYCGKPTGVDDAVCRTCGAAIRPIPGMLRSVNPKKQKLVKLGIAVNLVIVIGFVSAYAVLSMPKSVTRQLKSAAATVIMDSTGYKTLPLSAIAVVPQSIPPFDEPVEALRDVNENFTPEGVAVNTTYQLTVFAVYQSAAKEDVTGKAVFKSNNELVATVSDTGLVTAVGSGATTITITYTAAPGSSNLSGASAGKVPITVSFDVPILVQ